LLHELLYQLLVHFREDGSDGFGSKFGEFPEIDFEVVVIDLLEERQVGCSLVEGGCGAGDKGVEIEFVDVVVGGGGDGVVAAYLDESFPVGEMLEVLVPEGHF
jgi:hypothetical protein